MENPTMVENFVQFWLIVMILMVVPMTFVIGTRADTIHAMIKDLLNGDSWLTIMKRYF